MINKNYRFKKLSIIFLAILPFSFIISPSRNIAVLHVNIAIILAVIACVIIELIITKSAININGITPIILLCIIVSLFAILKSNTKDDFSEAMSLIAILFLFFFLSINKYDKDDISFLLNFIIFFGVFISVFLLLKQEGYTDVFGNYLKDRKSFYNLAGVMVDPNFLSSTMVIPAIIAFYKLFYSKKFLLKIMYASFLLIISIGILITGSRSAFVGLAIGIGFTFVHILLNKYNKSKSHVLLVFLLVFLLAIILVIILANIPEYMINRYLKGNYMDQSNMDRLDFWINSIEIIKEKPLFGYGFSHYININESFSGLDRDVHNTYLTLLFFFGIIGIIPFLMLFIYIIFKNLKKENIFILGIIGAFAFMALIISSHRSMYFVSTFSFLIILLNFMEKEKSLSIDDILN